MKAIAEYFRDLAADDRYFGAEPPTPDPAMLHQIAKREIQRRVDAKIEENSVVLRAGFADEVPEAPAPRLADAAPAVESAAAKLSRIRAATAQAAPALAQAAALASDFSEDEHAAAEAGVQSAPAFDAFDIDAFNDALLIADADQAADSLPESIPEVVALVDLAATDADLPESGLAADVDEDLADLAGLDAPQAQDVQLEEDLIAAADQDDDETEIAADDALLASLGALIKPEAKAAEPEAADETDLARFVDSDDDTDEVDTVPARAADQSDPAPVPTEKLERARARVIRIRRVDAAPVAAPIAEKPESALPQAVLSDELEAALQAELAALEAETHSAPVSRSKAVPVVVQASATEIVADVRKRLEAEAGDDAVSRLIAHTNSEMEGPETRRRQSAIAHLKAAVAATVADRQLNGPNAGQSGETRSEAYRSDLDRVVRPRQPGDVSAPSADRPSPLVLVSEQRIDRPRSLPAKAAIPAPQIVRPRRVSAVQLAARPAQETPDAEVQAALDIEEPVNVFTEGAAKSFVEYAEDRGATGLESLLEAAALYRAEVLHQAQFSRADLFEAVTSLPATADVTLEDTLRSFGTLLRDGRIAKVRRGQFRLTGAEPDLARTDRAAG
ncbi:MAG: hypothetical protein A3D16_10100 [Rhodobacterales bacterium RIFCSPHIGHO2_02_FULL_62_130]|nr:MAG: hypothetical protein A3D16_10100 [Rhodobacterales bacterium RIFCSPHIGHO2_02_FULL_62_130]OHC56361.1 MAG: hypothetical protein A3E48_21025 [Rhodobacterales bacterium RIFCSPHIGHO2_12_FULL_62_75]